MGTTPDEIRSDIEDTRDKLTDDVERIADRTSPARAVRRRRDRIRQAGQGVRQRMMGNPRVTQAQDRADSAAGQTADTVREAGTKAGQQAGRAAEAVRSAPQRALERTQGNPIAAGVIAFGAGLLASSLIRQTGTERDAARHIGERAGDVIEPAEQALRESAEKVKDEGHAAARESARELQETATDAAKATGKRSRETAQQVSEETTQDRS